MCSALGRAAKNLMALCESAHTLGDGMDLTGPDSARVAVLRAQAFSSALVICDRQAANLWPRGNQSHHAAEKQSSNSWRHSTLDIIVCLESSVVSDMCGCCCLPTYVA